MLRAHPPTRTRLLAAAALLACVVALACAGLLGGADTAAGEAPAAAGERQIVAGEVLVRYRGEARERLVELPEGVAVNEAARRLRRDDEVAWAGPNPIATLAGGPRDPGRSGEPGGWREDQWNFHAPPDAGKLCTRHHACGVDVVGAWRRLRKLGRANGRRPSGKRGPVVAVIDTGVAYRDRGRRFSRSPDLARRAFVKGKDFISRGRPPLDRNGHGTHVASTILERTGNRRGVTGIADKLRVMPIRVLNRHGAGSANDVARGIRWATRKGADVINLSLQFPPAFKDCSRLKGVCRAIRKAQRKRVVVVAPTGNTKGLDRAQMPGRISLAVAATTVRGCLADYSSRGAGTDISAPGGGEDAGDAGPACDRDRPAPGIVQLTLTPDNGGRAGFHNFGYPQFEGTSMAAPHVSAAAALVLGRGPLRRRVGKRPRPKQVEHWLECTARPPGADKATTKLYGAGLLDIGAALKRRSCPGGG